ncbi:MAG: hypothetical protein WD067_04885 [Gaiellaceae bacterium]
MAKKRKRAGNLTPEELARREETTRMLEERIAYHKAMAEQEEQRRARKSLGRRLLERLKLAA